MNLQQKAEQLSKTVFLGGPVKDFEAVGRLQFIMLLREGLYPDSKVVDIGCGCLRGGYWLIHFLNKDCYCGIEPNKKMLEEGIKTFLEDDVRCSKNPRFSYNSDFDFSVFHEKFDFFMARSIWTHASKQQIEKMLDGFCQHSSDNGIFLTSYLRASFFKHKEYWGDTWVGRSDTSDKPGVVCHSFKWVSEVCKKRNLQIVELKEGIYNNQIWLKITKGRAAKEHGGVLCCF